MGRYRLSKKDRFVVETDGGRSFALTKAAIDRFGPQLLGLGDVSRSSESTEAVCAIFDLAGFTTFCRQVDPHLAVPEFMSKFLDWLFSQLRTEHLHSEVDGGAVVYTYFPFFTKFMGDGVLFLWDTKEIRSEVGVFNIALTVAAICDVYVSTFLPVIRRSVVQPPAALRVGVARGRVYSVGDGNDFVGPCINIAARLQKLVPGLSYAFSRRGFDADRDASAGSRKDLLLKRVAIRGIGDDELVWVSARQYNALLDEDKAALSEP